MADSTGAERVKAIRLLALRRLRLQPLRAIIAALTVGAGVSLAVSVVVVLGSLDQSVLDAGRALAGPTPLRIIGATSRGGIDESLVGKVEQVEGVKAAIPLVQSITLAERTDGHDVPIIALGFDCRAEALFGSFGCTPEALAAGGDAPPFISPTLLRELGPGGQLRTDVGRLSLANAPSLDQLDAINGGRVVAVPLPRAQELFARPSRLDVIYLQPAAGADAGALRHRLTEVVGPNNGVLGSTDPPPIVGIIRIAFVPLFTIIALLTLSIGAVLVHNTITLSLEERRKQLAIVSALGGTAKVLVGGTVMEAALLGLAGGALGALGGVGVAHPISASLNQFTQKSAGIPLEVHVQPAAIVLALVLGVAVAAFSAIRPARRTLRMDVSAELSNRDRREEAKGAVSAARLVLLFAVVVFGMGLCVLSQYNGAIEPWQATLAPVAFLVTFTTLTLVVAALAPHLLRTLKRGADRGGASSRLALANLVREPRRTGVMAVALGFAVGVAFITASFNQSVRKGVSDNLTKNLHGVSVSTLDPDNTINIDAKLTPAILDGITKLPGVASVERGTTVSVGHDFTKLMCVSGYENPWLASRLIQGSKDRARFEAGEVLIGPGLARTTGARAGDIVHIDNPTGVADLTVLGIVQEGNCGGQNVLMTYPLLLQLYGPQPPDGVNVIPVPGVTSEQLAATIRASNLDPKLQVLTASQLAEKIADGVAQQLASFWALQRGLMVMAFVAVLSTLLLVGIQRQRELGLLAAVGMRPSELARMVLTEAVLVTIAGAILGLAVAVVGYCALLLITPVVIGFRDPFVVDMGAAMVYSLIAVVVAVLGAAWPSWRTSKIEVLRALQYE
jgi:putative ABC transport system permease protein